MYMFRGDIHRAVDGDDGIVFWWSVSRGVGDGLAGSVWDGAGDADRENKIRKKEKKSPVVCSVSCTKYLCR